MKNPFRPKPFFLPQEFWQEEQLFAFVFRQAREDYPRLLRAIRGAMPPFEKVGLWMAWLICLAIGALLWSQIQVTGWTLATLSHGWLLLLVPSLLGYGLWQQWRARQRYLRFVERFPLRTFIVYPSGCVVFASDERGQYVTPPVVFFSCLWKDVLFHSNIPERVILVVKGSHGVWISNRILGYSRDMVESSRILNELLARPVHQHAPIAEPR